LERSESDILPLTPQPWFQHECDGTILCTLITLCLYWWQFSYELHAFTHPG